LALICTGASDKIEEKARRTVVNCCYWEHILNSFVLLAEKWITVLGRFG